MSSEIKENLKSHDTWIRGLYMLLFALFYSVAEVVFVAVVLFQFVMTLVSGVRNMRLLELGGQLSRYTYQIFLFLSYNSEDLPFPFNDWPKSKVVHLDEHEHAYHEWQHFPAGDRPTPGERVEPEIPPVPGEVDPDILGHHGDEPAPGPSQPTGPKAG